MKPRAKVLFTSMAVILGLALAAVVYAAAIPGVEVTGKLPVAQGPAIVTTCGQSPGALMVKLLCDQAKVKCTEEELIDAKEFEAMIKSQKIKTLFLTMGTSLKGMGAAGIDIDQEVKRVKGLIDVANKYKITIIGTQLEGASRRTDETDEQSIRAVAPNADLIIIRKDVDFDGYFKKLAADKKIPMAVCGQQLDAKGVLNEVFN